MDSPNAKSTRSLTRVLNIRRRRSVDPLLPHPRCRESALIPANALLSLSLSLSSPTRRCDATTVGIMSGRSVKERGAKRAANTCLLHLLWIRRICSRVFCVYRQFTPMRNRPTWKDYTWAVCQVLEGRWPISSGGRERQRHPPPFTVSLDAVETVRGTTVALKFIRLPSTRNFTLRKISPWKSNESR